MRVLRIRHGGLDHGARSLDPAGWLVEIEIIRIGTLAHGIAPDRA